MKVYLDDMRDTPIGWIRVYTAQEAIDRLNSGGVTEISLDHDLGACKDCMRGRTVEQWLKESNYQEMPQCEHVGTGTTVALHILQMAEDEKPIPLVQLHTANPVGRERMRQIINAANTLSRTK